MTLRFDLCNLWCGSVPGKEDRNLIPMRPRLNGTPSRLMCIAAPFFRSLSRMESYPRPSGLKLIDLAINYRYGKSPQYLRRVQAD